VIYGNRDKKKSNKPHDGSQAFAWTPLAGSVFPQRLNRKLGIQALLQTVPLIAEPLPDGLETLGNLRNSGEVSAPYGARPGRRV
jgi:hypothetical protein